MPQKVSVLRVLPLVIQQPLEVRPQDVGRLNLLTVPDDDRESDHQNTQASRERDPSASSRCHSRIVSSRESGARDFPRMGLEAHSGRAYSDFAALVS